MSIISIYDIASSNWKTQKATSKDGDTPRRPRAFCTVAMSAQDYSSHQIYFYGGDYDFREAAYLPYILNDVWVLTLPSFQFIKVDNSAKASRFLGACAVISPQYLLAYRGSSQEPDSLEAQNASLALLDLTDLKWKTEYTPANGSTVYNIPQRVIEVIGGEYVLLISYYDKNSALTLFSETGNAAVTAPTGGFDDEFLSAVFNLSDSKRPIPSLVATSSASRNKLVIGLFIASAIAALVSIAGITLLFRRRQRIKLHALAEELGPKPWDRQEVDGNMVAPVNYELEGSRPVAHEIGSV